MSAISRRSRSGARPGPGKCRRTRELYRRHAARHRGLPLRHRAARGEMEDEPERDTKDRVGVVKGLAERQQADDREVAGLVQRHITRSVERSHGAGHPPRRAPSRCGARSRPGTGEALALRIDQRGGARARDRVGALGDGMWRRGSGGSPAPRWSDNSPRRAARYRIA